MTRISLPARLRTVLSTVALLLLLGGCIGSSPERLLAEARAAADRADYRTATIQLKTLLQKEPANAEAVLLLADVALDGNNAVLAERNYRRAGELGIDSQRYWTRWVESLLALGRFEDALARLGEFAPADAQSRARVKLLEGRGRTGLGQATEAEAAFKEAVAIDPKLAAAHLDLARLYTLTNRDAEAAAALNAALAADPEYPDALLLRAGRLMKAGDLKGAEAVLIKARDVGEKRNAIDVRATAMTSLAEVSLATGRVDEAADRTSQLARLVGEQASVLYLRARVALERNKVEEAKQLLQETLARSRNYLPAQRLLGAIFVLQNQFDLAEMYLKPVVAADSRDFFARRLLATVHLARNRPAEALPLLDNLATGNAESRETLLAMMGQANLQVGDVAKAIAYFREGSANFPDNPLFELGLGLTLLAEGRADEALEILRGIRDEASATTREAFVTIAYMQKGDTEIALDSARGLVKKYPDQAWSHNLLGSVLLASGRFPEAREALIKATAIDPQDSATLANLARAEQLSGDAEAAAKTWQQILAKDPGNLDAGFWLARLELDRGNVPAALKILEPMQKTSSRARLLLAAVLMDRGAREDAGRLAQDVLESEPDNSEAYNVAALVDLESGKLEEARRGFLRAAELRPSAAIYRLNLARAWLAEGNVAEARTVLDDARRLDPDSSQLHSLDVLIALRTDDIEGGRRIVEQMNARQIGDEALRTVLAGEVAAMAGDHAAAADKYAAAYKLRPSLDLAIKAYNSRRAAGKPGDTTLLADWAARNPDDWRSLRATADVFFAENQMDKAELYYGKALARAPRDLPTLNNLAWIYQERGDVRAVQLAEQALKIAGEDPAVLDTAGWAQLKLGTPARGLKLLQKAAELAPQDPDIRFHLAAALVQSGDRAQGRRLLTELLAKNSDFSSRSEAESLLATL